MQRARYGEAFEKMGLGVYTGEGGFYHWMKLPDGLNASELNRRLFSQGAAILEGADCDMGRPRTPRTRTTCRPMRVGSVFSFGPLLPETFESDVAILGQVLSEYRADMAAGLAR